jgi:general secretion pathway protein L
MAERLGIRLHDDGPVEWLVLDEHGNRIGAIQRDTLDAIAPQAAGRRVTVFVPTAAVTLTSATLPSQNAQRIAQALPFALEERLSEDIEDLHFAAGPVRADGSRTVAVVRHAAMDSWLAALADAGIKPDLLLPDVFALPYKPDTWQIAAEPDSMCVRIDASAGFAADMDMAATLLALKLEEAGADERPQAVAICAADPDDPAAMAIAAVCAAAGIDNVDVEALPDGSLLSSAAAGITASAGFNLLQGAYRPRSDWERRWRRWRPAAVLAAAWIVLVIAWQGVDFYQLHRRDAALKAEIAKTFHQALPDVQRMSDPRAQMTSRLRALEGAGNGTSSPLFTILSALGDGLSASAATGVTALSYHNEIVELQLTTPDVKTLDDLRNQLAGATNFTVAIESANAAGKSVDGRLRIGGAP